MTQPTISGILRAEDLQFRTVPAELIMNIIKASAIGISTYY